MDGADEGDLGENDRLRTGGEGRSLIGSSNGDEGTVLLFSSVGRLARVCFDSEDISRLAAAIGPMERHSVIELVRFSFDGLDSSAQAESSRAAILERNANAN